VILLAIVIYALCGAATARIVKNAQPNRRCETSILLLCAAIWPVLWLARYFRRVLRTFTGGRT
jgi:hypothetical protein